MTAVPGACEAGAAAGPRGSGCRPPGGPAAIASGDRRREAAPWRVLLSSLILLGLKFCSAQKGNVSKLISHRFYIPFNLEKHI